jgi:hypothetical protein
MKLLCGFLRILWWYTCGPRVTCAISYSTSKEETMSNPQDNSRVLSRLGARVLTDKEAEQVSAAMIIRPRCTFNPVTCVTDGMCSPEPAC